MTHPLLDPNARLVLGHRGNRVRSPENTIASLRQAVELGADGLEIDVRLTRDGVPILMHDASVDRTTSGRGRVSDVDSRELLALDVRGADGAKVDGVRVPTLEQVLDEFRATPIVIDVKEMSVAEPTVRLVHKFGLASRVVVGADDGQISSHLYRSGVPACASPVDAFAFIPFSFASVTPPAGNYSVLSITPRLLGIRLPVRRMVELAKRRGVPTQVWTVNDPTEARQLWTEGAAAVITDDPAAILRARSQ